MRIALLLLLVGCSSSSDTCTTTLTGNLTESAKTTNCASLSSMQDDVTLAIALTLPDGASFAISIDLGVMPTAGTFLPQTTGAWSVLGSRTTADGGECSYAAGSTAVPLGSFDLELSELTATEAHGTLTLAAFVQAQPSTDCGSGDNEMIDVAF